MALRKLGCKKINGKRIPVKSSTEHIYLIEFEHGQEVLLEALNEEQACELVKDEMEESENYGAIIHITLLPKDAIW